MKILFVPSAEPSHVVAMAPAAWAARLAGHDIRVAAAPAVVGTVVDAGLTAVPVGTDHTMRAARDPRRCGGERNR